MTIHTIAVLGLGTMGHAIAQVFAQAGYRVRGFDAVPAARATCHARLRRNGAAPATVRRLRIFDTVAAAVAGADFVLEAVREDLPTKQQLFAELETLVRSQTILASNTSTFPMTKIAAKLQRPERCVDMHWFNPPHIVPLVEVVPGRKTSAATVKTTLALVRRVGKVAVHVRKEVPGFITNRVQVAMLREVLDLWQNGVASPEDIDRAVSASLGFRLAALGPLQIADFTGHDVLAKVYREIAPRLRSDGKLPAALAQMVKAGHLGVKAGRGIYRYTPRSARTKMTERDRKFRALAKLLQDA
ncbi:MAG: putative 3-hydroxybutyryl-CoA dehydrogenase [Verrucomicrobiae bacterium]|nr:putative 3-hydroxybutyryl-CoA dehydrogenase [Verrucomicrobiae bacterium]